MLNSLGFSIWQMAMEPLPIDAGENKQTDSVSECCQTDDDVDDDDARTNNDKRYRRLAMACDDGSLRLYTISDSGDLCYLKTFPRVSGKLILIFLILSILCVPYLVMFIAMYIFIYRRLFSQDVF